MGLRASRIFNMCEHELNVMFRNPRNSPDTPIFLINEAVDREIKRKLKEKKYKIPGGDNLTDKSGESDNAQEEIKESDFNQYMRYDVPDEFAENNEAGQEYEMKGFDKCPDPECKKYLEKYKIIEIDAEPK